MNLSDEKRKSVLSIPDELVVDVNYIRYDDVWWVKQNDGGWAMATEGEGDSLRYASPFADGKRAPYLDLTPGMGDCVYDENGEKVEKVENEETTESE